MSYLGSLIGLTLWKKDYGNSTELLSEESSPGFHPDKLVAYFSMIHVGIWIMVGVMDRWVWLVDYGG